MIEQIKEYFLNYPKIGDTSEIVTIDYLPKGTESYAIYSLGDVNGGWISKWLSEGGLKQFSFIFASRFVYSPVAVINIQNSNFYLDLQNWIEANNKKGIVPKVQGAIRVEVAQTGTLSLVDESQALAEYQMAARLIYEI
jgi:hypothetical protein